MNTRPKEPEPPEVLLIDTTEMCNGYPDECEFCDHNCSGFCTLFHVNVPNLEDK